jgi:hypothetical protein
MTIAKFATGSSKVRKMIKTIILLHQTMEMDFCKLALISKILIWDLEAPTYVRKICFTYELKKKFNRFWFLR